MTQAYIKYEIRTIFDCPKCGAENKIQKTVTDNLNILVNYGEIYERECIECCEKIMVRHR
jgi:transcription elongation factor Elf1